MDKKDKQIIGVLAAALAAIFLLKKQAEGANTAAAVTIAVLDSAGNEVLHNSPVDLEAGESYTVSITVTNQSTQNGQPVAVELISSIGAMIVGLPPLIADTRADSYSPGESKTFTYPVTMPDYAITDGMIRAIIFDLWPDDPNHQQLALGELEFNVVQARRPAVDGMGDLDNDGYVSLADADIVKAYAFGSDPRTLSPLSIWEFVRRADLNCDTKIDAGDITAIKGFIAYGTLPGPVVGSRAAISGMGDINNDEQVSSVDIILCGFLLGGWAPADVSPLAPDEAMRRADLNADGVIDILDIIAISNFIATGELPQPGRLPPCGSYGDVDGDGYVTEADAALISQYVVGAITLTADQLVRADVTGDGQVTGADAMTISQYVQGVINTFPVCTLPPPIVYAASVDVGVA